MKVFGKEFILNAQCLLSFITFYITLAQCKKNCWMKFDEKQYFDAIEELDDKYGEVKKEFQDTNGGSKLDKEMLVIMLKNRGIAERALHAAQGMKNEIPAGINLGGYCMMKMPDSVLFFHRLKLRNNTVFRILDIKNDLANLQIKTQIHLNDLHLFGSYDCTVSAQPGHLFYEPTFGQIEILLKNVTYNMEGRYRLLKNRLTIDMVISEVQMEDVLVMYRNKNSTLTIKLYKRNVASFFIQHSREEKEGLELRIFVLSFPPESPESETLCGVMFKLKEDIFLERLKLDLDKWLKDYFNDYLMYFVVAENPEFEQYYKEKTKVLNNYTTKFIDVVINRIKEVKADAVQLPKFTINDSIDKEIRLSNGVLRGLDSVYRRSIATDGKELNIRHVDSVVGFSDLKLTYRYDAILKAGYPPVKGMLFLSADDLTAHMRISLIKDPPAGDINFKFLEQTKPESLTVEGPANRVISNFKYLLERHIIAIMVSTLVHNINMLSTLDRCVPGYIPSTKDSSELNVEDDNQTNLSNIPYDDITPETLSNRHSDNEDNSIKQDTNEIKENTDEKNETINETNESNNEKKETTNEIKEQDSNKNKYLTLAYSTENENSELSSNKKHRRGKILRQKQTKKFAFKHNLKRNKRY